MKRSYVTRTLIEGRPELLEACLGEIEAAYEVEIVRAPEKSLAMGKARDSVSMQPFFLGELLMTECTVAVNGVHGFGALLGEDAEKAYALAVADAALRAKLPETAAWPERFEQEALQIEARFRREQALAQRTKVEFNTMEEAYGNR